MKPIHHISFGIILGAITMFAIFYFGFVERREDIEACFFAKGMVSVVRQYKIKEIGRFGFLEFIQGDYEACRNINEELDYPTFKEMGGQVWEGVILDVEDDYYIVGEKL